MPTTTMGLDAVHSPFATTCPVIGWSVHAHRTEVIGAAPEVEAQLASCLYRFESPQVHHRALKLVPSSNFGLAVYDRRDRHLSRAVRASSAGPILTIDRTIFELWLGRL